MRWARRSLAPTAVAVLALAGCGSSIRLDAAPAEAGPECEPTRRLGILAQAVPTAAFVPCITDKSGPWRFETLDVERGRARLSFVYVDPQQRTATVELRRSCDTSGASELPPDEPGLKDVASWRKVATVATRLAGTDFHVFPGGCVVTRYDLPRTTDGRARLVQLEAVVGLFPRDRLSEELEQELGRELDELSAPGATASS